MKKILIVLMSIILMTTFVIGYSQPSYNLIDTETLETDVHCFPYNENVYCVADGSPDYFLEYDVGSGTLSTLANIGDISLAYNNGCKAYSDGFAYCSKGQAGGFYKINLSSPYERINLTAYDYNGSQLAGSDACDFKPNTDELWCFGWNDATLQKVPIRYYDVSEDSWTTYSVADITPTKLYYTDCQFRPNTEELWCGGGYDGNALPYVYKIDTSLNITTEFDISPYIFEAGNCRWYNDEFYCYGGDDVNVPINTSFVFNPDDNSTTLLDETPMPLGWYYCAEVDYFTDICIGGYDADWNYYNDIYSITYGINQSSIFYSGVFLNESLTLTQDYYGIENIQISANDLVLDCAGHTIYGTFNESLYGGNSSSGRLFYPQDNDGNHQNFRLQHCVLENVFNIFDTHPVYAPNNFILDDITFNGEGLSFESDCGVGEGWEWCEGTYWEIPTIFTGNWDNDIQTENITLMNSQITEASLFVRDNSHWNDAENSIKKNFYVHNNVFNANVYFPDVFMYFQSMNGVYVYNNTFNGNDLMGNSFLTVSDCINVEVYDNNGYDGESFRVGEPNWGDENINALVYNNNIDVENVISLNTRNSQLYNNNFVVTNGNVFGRFVGDAFNITGNYFNEWNEINLNSYSDTGETFFYGNNANQLYDNTDYGSGNYVTFCVDGIGNDLVYYEGGGYGTCVVFCRDTLQAGCIFEEGDDITLTESEYNVTPENGFWDTPLVISQPNVVLDCNGSTLFLDIDHYGFIYINAQNVTVENCVFERRYTEQDPEGCYCMSDITLSGMIWNNWDDPENPYYQGSTDTCANSKILSNNFENSYIGDGVSLNVEMGENIEIAGNTINNIYLRGNFNFHDNLFYDIGLPTRQHIYNNEGDYVVESLFYNNIGGIYTDWVIANGDIENLQIYNSSMRNILFYNTESTPKPYNLNITGNDIYNAYFEGYNIQIRDNNFGLNSQLNSFDDTDSFIVVGNNLASVYDFTDYGLYNIVYCEDLVGNNVTSYDGNNTLELGTCYVCTEDWVQDPEVCMPEDLIYITYTDQNACGTYDNLPPNNGTTIVCDYCTPDWQTQFTECQENNTKIMYYIDGNDCGEPESIPLDNSTVVSCDYCIPDWEQYDTGCQVDDTAMIYYLDNNDCGEPETIPVNNGTISSCNYCTIDYHLEEGECINYQKRDEYVLDNYETCCALTGISADCDLPTNPSAVSCGIGTHSGDDISGVVIDTAVETGIEVTKYVGVISVVSGLTWLLFLL